MKTICKFTHSLGHLVVTLLLFVFFIIGGTDKAWGATMTARLNTSVSPAGTGTAYVAEHGETMGTSTSKDQTGSSSEGKFFDIVATPNRGYKLKNWTLGSVNTWFYTAPKFVAADLSTELGTSVATNEAIVRHATGSSNWTSTNTVTVTANFESAGAAFNVQYKEADNGIYTIIGPSGTPVYGSPKEGDGVTYSTYSGDNIKLTATPVAGYTFIRYYTIDGAGNVKTLGTPYQTEQQIVNIKDLANYSGTVYVCAEFSNQPFAIGERTYETLDAAIQAVQSSSNKTILVIGDATVQPGNYTLPSNALLLIPRRLGHTAQTSLNSSRTLAKTPAPSLYRKLTLATGANLIVNGTIEVGGMQSSGGQGMAGAGIPVGSYGQIEMQQGSSMTLNNNAKLYAYGFITGEGTIDARRGSTVYEQFQMYDWKGGSHASGFLNNSEKVFPINQYYIQNVEVATTYHPGAALIGFTSIAVTSIDLLALSKTTISINCDNIGVIGVKGTSSMFLMDETDMSEDTWVRKRYDVATDRQVYEVNSSAELGSMTINMQGVPILGDLNFDSRNYTLPITNNLKIHLLDGKMGITQSTVMLPGAEIEIDKTATVSINSGKSLYLYDIAQWGNYVFTNNSGNGYATHIKYRPGSTPSNTSPRDITALSNDLSDNKIHSAAINVHGTFDVQGALYTTAGGANIYSSTADAGTVLFTNSSAAPAASVYQPQSYQVNSHETFGIEVPEPSTITYAEAACTSAQLKNDVGSAYGSYTPTAAAKSPDSYCFIDFVKTDDGKGEWVSLTAIYDPIRQCYPFVKDQNDVYYAKPSDYVALANGMEENADHTYSSADGTRTFILLGDCQWWEVEYDAQSGLYYCDKDKNYYFYDEDDGWVIKTFTITWKNYDGTIIQDENHNDVIYTVPYLTNPNYHHTTPSRPDDAGYYTYDFTGWAPAFSPVTADVTYVAQYEKNPVRYTITWQNANGSEREVDYYTRDEWPVCRLAPDMTAWEWRPAVAAVTGNATYRLYARDTEGPFTIKYVNWDWNGQEATVLKSESVAKNGALTPPANPTKTALTDIEFVFAGWKGANNVVYAPNALPVATENITYTAMYNERPIEYTITWKNYNDDVLFQDEHVAPNAVPQYTGATPTKILEDDYNYMFSGWSPAIVAATSDKEYTAQYIAVPKNRTINAEEAIAASTIQEVTTLTITATGQLTIPGTSRIDATNLILEATENSSGELFATNTSINATNVYYDLTLDTDRRHWRAFGVPWPVGDLKVTKLVEVKNRTGAECHRELALGRDYDIMYYNGAYRAANGPGAACWEYVQDHGNTLTPGQGYMIAFTSEVGTIRFTKAAEANVVYNSTSLPIVENTGDPTNPDANWNAIANPMPYHSLLNVGALLVQVHDGGEIGHDGYKNAPAGGKYVVGKMVYFQAPTAKSTVAISKAGSEAVITPYAAPARREAEREVTLNDFYHVELLNIEGVKNADVFIRAEEDKPDTYYIGKDVACMGLTSARAQMWVNRYNVKLCMNTTAPINDVAEYAISVYAPSNGEYTIRLNHQPEEDYTLYLTRDGEAIWDLSMGDYVTDLTSGVHKEFGLRLSANKAPEVATGMDEAVVDAKGETRKVIIDNNVYIIRGGEVYTMTGAKIQ